MLRDRGNKTRSLPAQEKICLLLAKNPATFPRPCDTLPKPPSKVEKTRESQAISDVSTPHPAPLDPDPAEPERVAGTPAEAARLLANPSAQQLGRFADAPIDIAWPGWRAVIRRTALEMLSDRVSLVAAGCAFYATLALFPAISMLVSVYGLLSDPSTVLPQLAVLQNLLPPAAFKLIADRVQDLISKPPATLGTSLLFSTTITLWSSASGTKALIGALNLAYEEREQRSFLRFQLVAFTMTLFVIVGSAVGLGLLVALPALLEGVGYAFHERAIIRAASFALLVFAVLLALSALYRYAPCRAAPQWNWVTPGSMLATFLWVVASALFSWYVATFATYDATYGPLGTVVAIMMWFWVTAYAVLLGAELNAELELQTVRDSTDGPPRPLGRRGAYVADHVAENRRR